MTSQSTYRPSAVAHLSSPEQLDTMVRVTRPRGWIALAAVALLLLSFIIWTFVGTVQTTFPGSGVLLTQHGTFNSVSTRAGQVTDTFVSQGDVVTIGQRLATVASDEGGTTEVLAKNGGLIVEMLAYPGDRVDVGSPIVTVQPDDEDLKAFLYVPVSGSQPIKPGMPVQISVTTVSSETYGLLLGTVTKVGSFPATRAGVDALLNNSDITAIVVGGAPVIQIEVQLTESASTESGYAWTSAAGPPTVLPAGTLVNASVTTAVQHPINMLFPSDRTPE